MWSTAAPPVSFLLLFHSPPAFTWLVSEPVASTCEIRDTVPCLVYPPVFVQENLFCSNNMGTHWDREEAVAFLRWAFSKPQRAMERDRSLSRHFRYGTFTFHLKSVLCALCCTDVPEVADVLLCNCLLCLKTFSLVFFWGFLTFCQNVSEVVLPLIWTPACEILRFKEHSATCQVSFFYIAPIHNKNHLMTLVEQVYSQVFWNDQLFTVVVSQERPNSPLAKGGKTTSWITDPDSRMVAPIGNNNNKNMNRKSQVGWWLIILLMLLFFR